MCFVFACPDQTRIPALNQEFSDVTGIREESVDFVLLIFVHDAILGIHLNPILLRVFLFSLTRLFSLFRRKSEVEARYSEVAPVQRWIMAGLCFGLVGSSSSRPSRAQ